MVKSIYFGPDGPDGDRAWACISADGLVVSAKNPRRWGRILSVTATLSDARDGDVLVSVPGGEPLAAGTAEADEALSGWLGEGVHLASEVPPQARLHRLWSKEPGMIPEWAQNAAGGDEEVSDIAGALPGGRFVDFAAVHLVTARALDELKRECPPSDVRRLRPNLVLALGQEPAPGDRIQVGPEVTLRVLIPTPRCVIPSAAQPGLEHSPEVLRAIAGRRIEVPGRGRAACFGHYAQVLSAGAVTVGHRAKIAA